MHPAARSDYACKPTTPPASRRSVGSLLFGESKQRSAETQTEVKGFQAPGRKLSMRVAENQLPVARIQRTVAESSAAVAEINATVAETQAAVAGTQVWVAVFLRGWRDIKGRERRPRRGCCLPKHRFFSAKRRFSSSKRRFSRRHRGSGKRNRGERKALHQDCRRRSEPQL